MHDTYGKSHPKHHSSTHPEHIHAQTRSLSIRRYRHANSILGHLPGPGMWGCPRMPGMRAECAERPKPLQAALAINRLGPCAAARARINRFLNARCSTYTTTPHFLSMKAQKCDPTCTSPATGRSGTPSGPGNTTRQIRTLHRGGHVPKAPPVRTLTGRTHRSCMRAPPAPLTCPAAPNDCCHSV